MAQDRMSMCMKSTMSLSAAISNFKFLYICITFVAIDEYSIECILRAENIQQIFLKMISYYFLFLARKLCFKVLKEFGHATVS